MTGLEYEKAVCRYLSQHGYYGTSVTKASGDYGVDVIARKGRHKYAVQCKYYANPVGIKAVQEVYAGMQYYGCDRAMVVTNSRFTPAAVELSRKTGVTLMQGIRPSSFSFGGTIKVVGALFGLALAALIVNDCITDPSLIPIYAQVGAVLASPVVLILLIKRLIKKIIKHRKQKEIEQEEVPIPTPTIQPAPIPEHQPEVKDVSLRIQLVREALTGAECVNGLNLESAVYFLAYSPTIYFTLLQRHFKIGYARAGRIIGELQAHGLLSPTSPFTWLV